MKNFLEKGKITEEKEEFKKRWELTKNAFLKTVFEDDKLGSTGGDGVEPLTEAVEMGEDRRPKVCLKEEIRAMENGVQSKWGKKR